MGLAIIKSVMDSVRYHSDHGVNRFTAVRRWQR
jgi:anti-sigma regulatory factor (Ser/Thr protein kinase)